MELIGEICQASYKNMPLVTKICLCIRLHSLRNKTYLIGPPSEEKFEDIDFTVRGLEGSQYNANFFEGDSRESQEIADF